MPIDNVSQIRSVELEATDDSKVMALDPRFLATDEIVEPYPTNLQFLILVLSLILPGL